jgi:hypothetical protein
MKIEKTVLISARVPISIYMWLKKMVKMNKSTLTQEIVYSLRETMDK